MTIEHQNLWESIRAFPLDSPQASLTFSDRLARENDWQLEFALRVILEYKKFIFLISTTDHPLTPSDEVDQAWHLHLLYTESYWQDFMPLLPQPIQHGPTKGGQKERDKFNDWYELTKQKYQEVFHKTPPKDIWPSSAVRFGQIDFKRVNLDRNWVIPKPKFFSKWKF